MKKYAVGLLCVLLLLCGCGSKYTTLMPDPATGKKWAYQADREELLSLARQILNEVHTGGEITSIEEKGGFGLRRVSTVAIEFYTHNVLFLPVKGKTVAGETVDAYAFDVYGGGSYPGGSINEAIASDLIKALDAKYPRVTVE